MPVLAYLTALPWATYPAALGLFMGAALMAVVGLWDDLRPLGKRVRFGTQSVSALMVVWGLQLQIDPLASQFVDVWEQAWPVWIMVAALFALLWHINLYNFMDGIDGIAGAQCLLLCVGVQLLAGGMSGWAGELAWVGAGASLGFLLFNWPPAKIFMGDVGSGFLGLVSAYLVIAAYLDDGVPLIASMILLAGFWFDASYTLCVRMLTGQTFMEAHRSHLYQKLAARKGHLWTTGLFVLFGCFYLCPLAWLSAESPRYGWAFLVVALLPLALAARRYDAGIPEPSE